MLIHIMNVLQQHGFVVKKPKYYTGLPAAQTCLPLKMGGALWKAKYDNRDPELLSNGNHI